MNWQSLVILSIFWIFATVMHYYSIEIKFLKKKFKLFGKYNFVYYLFFWWERI